MNLGSYLSDARQVHAMLMQDCRSHITWLCSWFSFAVTPYSVFTYYAFTEYAFAEYAFTEYAWG